jgi:hypothetical protein
VRSGSGKRGVGKGGLTQKAEENAAKMFFSACFITIPALFLKAPFIPFPKVQRKTASFIRRSDEIPLHNFRI